jgi:DNA invertase Pin-like site-specific DNA recombinase
MQVVRQGATKKVVSKTIEAYREPVLSMIRVSTDEQAGEDRGGIPAQVEACRRIALQNNLEIKWKIQIEGVSGAAVMRSPGMAELKRIVAAGGCKGIVLKEESRLMRPENFGDYSLLQLLVENNVKLYFLDRILDLSTPDGRFWTQLKFGMAGLELSNLRARMDGGKRAKRARGEWPFGENVVPLGLKLVIDKRKWRMLEVDPETIGPVKRLFSLFLEGHWSFGTLSRETGISVYSIRYMLKNELYTGVHVVKQRVDPKLNVYRSDGSIRYARKVPIALEDQERIQMFENPPVSPKAFARVQQLLVLKNSQRSTLSPDRDDPFLYRGFLRCAECGLNVTTLRYKRTGLNQYTAYYYVCKGANGSSRWDAEAGKYVPNIRQGSCGSLRMRSEALEAELDKLIGIKLGSKEFWNEAVAAHMNRDKAVEDTREQELLVEIANRERAIERLQQMYIRGKIEIEAFDKNHDKEKARLDAARKTLKNFKPGMPSEISMSAWFDFALAARQWHKLTFAQKRSLLGNIAPLFEVAGYNSGKKRHDTLIDVKVLRLDLGDDNQVVINLLAA